MRKDTAQITRRRVLIAGSAAIAVGSLLLIPDGLFEDASPLADSYAARRIGGAVRRHVPEPRGNLAWRTPDTVAQWVARLRQLIHDDFETNRLVQVDGWWLAETELRLCVLIHAHNA
ncbi:MAG: hypothetical protein IPG06_23950 [Haliea sp.]|nr:hypothetical protein [Haliea sp.]